LASDALVRITDAANPQISDARDNLFGISDVPQFADWNSLQQCNSGLGENLIKAIVVGCNGKIYAGTANSGLLVLDGGNWFQFSTANSEIPGNSILSMAMQGDGALWIGTNGQGLARFTEAGWDIFTTSHGLPHNRIWAIAYDRKKNDVWVGTSNGLARYNAGGWTTFAGLLPSVAVYAIAIAPEGKIWLGTADGLIVFDGDTWQQYTPENSGLLDKTVLSLAIDKAGRVWAGTPAGLNRFDGKNWVAFTTENSPLPASSIRAIQIDENDSKWIGTWGGGLARLAQGWTIYQAGASGLLDDFVTSLFIDCKGYKWIGTENGGFAQFMGDPALPVSVEDAVSFQPSAFSLEQNYPNPFNPSTVIRFQLPVSSDVKLSIYNLAGQLVRTLARGKYASGNHEALWDGMDNAGRRVASGVYVYRLEAGAFTFSRKLVVVK
jgi:ligand-binding sensor domain-containing protein